MLLSYDFLSLLIPKGSLLFLFYIFTLKIILSLKCPPPDHPLRTTLILELNDSLGTTMVVVTHELASIFAISSGSVFLDVSKRTMMATGNPNQLLAETQDPTLRLFLTRGEKS